MIIKPLITFRKLQGSKMEKEISVLYSNVIALCGPAASPAITVIPFSGFEAISLFDSAIKSFYKYIKAPIG